MTPAEKLVKAAGSVTKLAALLGVDRSWVWRWLQPVAKGGTGGRVPAPHMQKVLRLARSNGWRITAEDLLGVSSKAA